MCRSRRSKEPGARSAPDEFFFICSPFRLISDPPVRSASLVEGLPMYVAPIVRIFAHSRFNDIF
jgi:hypothetical protein